MYLDHRITIKIARVLDLVDMSALLLDANGSVNVRWSPSGKITLPLASRSSADMSTKSSTRAIFIVMR